MDLKEIIKDIGKYHYVLVVGKKAGILGSGNESNDAKKKTLEKIKLKNGKLNNQLVVKLKFIKVKSSLLKENVNSKIKTVGGPIQINIDFYEIIDNQVEKLNEYSKNNKLFITSNFLKRKGEISSNDIKLIASAAHNNKLKNELLVLNTIDKLVKI